MTPVALNTEGASSHTSSRCLDLEPLNTFRRWQRSPLEKCLASSSRETINIHRWQEALLGAVVTNRWYATDVVFLHAAKQHVTGTPCLFAIGTMQTAVVAAVQSITRIHAAGMNAGDLTSEPHSRLNAQQRLHSSSHDASHSVCPTSTSRAGRRCTRVETATCKQLASQACLASSRDAAGLKYMTCWTLARHLHEK